MYEMALRWPTLSIVRMKLTRNRRMHQAAVFVAILTLLAIVWGWPDEKKLAGEEKDREILESWQGRQACKRPDMRVFSPEMMKYVRKVKPIICEGDKDWVEVDGCTADITPEARRKHGQIDCKFTDLKRVSDFSVRPDSTTQSVKYQFISSDFVQVECKGQSGKTWSNIIAGARCFEDIMDLNGWDKVPKQSMKLNVLILGFDSVSRLNFIRKLPLSYEFLTQELGAMVLQGYNIVGDGTPQAIIPILTGKTERELPETRKRIRESTYVNVYPFLWNDFKDAGYVTGYMEDTPNQGIFTHRLKGFSYAPTDHYMRTFFLHAERYYHKFSRHCLGSKPRHKLMMDYIKSVFKVHKDEPKFVFGFQGEISHNDINMVGAADRDLLDWLKWYKKEHWKDTVLILMSDHGNRYGPSRATQQGKLEERLPFFSFTFPPWFGKAYPKALKNFQTNTRRLTTPFDVHATLASILDPPSFGMGNLSHRGISLFQEVPPSRTCNDAFIEPHWCACLEWQSIDKYDPIANTAGEVLVQHMNDNNAQYTSQCQLMGLRHVVWAAKLVPSEAFQKFRKTKDMDGLIPDMSGKMAVTAVVFQLQFVTDPGPAMFEAAVTYDPSKGYFSIRIEEISRVNEYGAQAKCLPDTLEHLRKFCYCK